VEDASSRVGRKGCGASQSNRNVQSGKDKFKIDLGLLLEDAINLVNLLFEFDEVQVGRLLEHGFERPR
jgi:hypothetical protein